MIDLTGKSCAHPAYGQDAAIAVWGEGPRKDSGAMMRVEFGVCEAHEHATCGNDECANFPSAYIKDEREPPRYLFSARHASAPCALGQHGEDGSDPSKKRAKGCYGLKQKGQTVTSFGTSFGLQFGQGRSDRHPLG